MRKLILALYILYLPFQLKFPQVPGINTINAFLLLLIVIFIAQRNKDFNKPVFETPLIIFLSIWTLSFLHTLFMPRGMWTWIVAKEFKRLITLVLGYFVFSRCVKDKKDWLFLFYAFLLSMVLVGAHTWRGGMLAGSHFADFKRSSGPFGIDWRGSDIAGGFLATFAPFLLAYFFFAKKRIFKILSFLGTVICVLGIFATYSRGSILALGVSFVVVVFVSFKHLLKSSKITVFILIIIFIGLIVKWQYWMPESIVNRFQGTVQEQTYTGEASLDESSQGRIAKWEGGINIFMDNPLFGAGFQRPQYELGVDTHNAFILILAEMGIFGLLVFLWFLWALLKEARFLLNTEFNFVGLGLIGCVIAFIFVNMFYSNFFRDTVVGTFWIGLGLLAGSKSFIVSKENSKKKEKVIYE